MRFDPICLGMGVCAAKEKQSQTLVKAGNGFYSGTADSRERAEFHSAL